MDLIKFKEAIIISVFFICINYAQTTSELNLVKTDTSKQKPSTVTIEKQSLHLDELKLFYNLNNQSFYIPEYKIIYPSTPRLPINDYSIKNYNVINGLNSFNESFLKLLSNKYPKRGMYDLGEFGRYLVITKKIIAIILWLLTF